jgi:hypothetical protein
LQLGPPRTSTITSWPYGRVQEAPD